ncbi:MAG TPA: hypothetical protein DCZ92_10390 [Elusimicrobia bacterium]|nr:hypothetical protein [Elusimicrobiota bacterium]
MGRLTGKAGALIRKKPRESFLLFLFCSLVFSAVSAYFSNASRFSIELLGTNKILSEVRVYGILPGGGVFDLERRGPAWVGGREYADKICLSLPKNGVSELYGIKIALGEQRFEYRVDFFSRFEFLRVTAADKSVWDIYTLPRMVRDFKSLFPGFTPVNWAGDLPFLGKMAGYFSACCLCLALFLVPLGRSGREPGAFWKELRGSLSSLSGGSLSRLSSRDSGPAPAGGAAELPRWAHLAFVFLLGLCAVGVVAPLQVDPHHDGIMLKPAMDVAAGYTLFRDTFTQYGALTTWCQALAIKLFGGSLLVLRLLTAFLYGTLALLLWLVNERFLPRYLNTFSCASWLLMGHFFVDNPSLFVMPWSTVFAVCSCLLSLHLLLLYLEKGRLRFLAACGVVAALTFWFKINYGAISLLSSLVFLALLQLRAGRGRAAAVFGAYLGGWLGTHALFAAWLGLHGSLRDFYLQSVKFALYFSSNTQFAIKDPFVVGLLKSLLQVDSPHGGISFLWLLLPLGAFAVFLRSAGRAVSGDDGLQNRRLLAVSCAAGGLWLGYYPIPALFHMHMSSPLFFGLLALLALRLSARLGLSGHRFLVLGAVALIFLPDLGYRFKGAVYKARRASKWERIETPAFLRGMYVPSFEKVAYAELESLINSAPGGLINLTNSGIYSLYKAGTPNFHKLYLDWGWDNAFLYPDYVPALVKRVSLGTDAIISNTNFMLPGYIPVKVFNILNLASYANRAIVLLLPGRAASHVVLSGVDAVMRPQAADSLPRGYRFGLKAVSPAVIESVVAKIVSWDTLPKKLGRYEYEYNVLPKTLDPGVKKTIEDCYAFDPVKDAYIASIPVDKKAAVRLMEAFSGMWLYETGFFRADTFYWSLEPKIDLVLNGSPVDSLTVFRGNVKFRAGDRLDLVVPAGILADSYVARLRINYAGGTYQEEVIRVIRM